MKPFLERQLDTISGIVVKNGKKTNHKAVSGRAAVRVVGVPVMQQRECTVIKKEHGCDMFLCLRNTITHGYLERGSEAQ